MAATAPDNIDAAALDLAISARELLGLPVQRCDQAGPSTAPTLPYQPPSLTGPPTALEFARRMANPSPFIVQNALSDRPRLKRWRDPGYLAAAMGDNLVKVSLTPDGRADDIKQLPKTGQDVFALPAETSMTVAQLLNKVNRSSSQSHATSSEPLHYLQSQDSNLTDPTAGDLGPLLRDLKDSEGNSDIAWASEAIGSTPEALNVWIGSTHSRSSMHRDHYENLFYTLRGTKVFTVFPPAEAYFLCEDQPYQVYRHSASPPYDLEPDPQGTPPTPWIPVDPTEPPTSQRNSRYPHYAKGLKPLSIRVEEGQMLYLPAG